jgi:hypothetical protein
MPFPASRFIAAGATADEVAALEEYWGENGEQHFAPLTANAIEDEIKAQRKRHRQANAKKGDTDDDAEEDDESAATSKRTAAK